MIHDDGRSYRPFHKNTILIEPLTGDGFTQTGIEIQHNARLPRVLGLVMECHSTVQKTRPEIKPGAVVVFRQHAYDEAETASGLTLYVLNISNVRAIIDFPQVIDDNDGAKEFPPIQQLIAATSF